MGKRKRGRQPLPRNIEEYVITASNEEPGMKRLALAEKVEQELKERALTTCSSNVFKTFSKSP